MRMRIVDTLLPGLCSLGRITLRGRCANRTGHRLGRAEHRWGEDLRPTTGFRKVQLRPDAAIAQSSTGRSVYFAKIWRRGGFNAT